MPTIVLKPVSTDDLDILQAIGRQTFFESFAEQNTEENMRHYLAEAFSREKLAAELGDANAQFFFALSDEAIAGYLKINFGAAQTELQDQRAVEIERIYVLKQFQGQGIGQRLFEKAIDVAHARGADYVWLGVWEANKSARGFYEKNGFVEFDRHTFRLGDDLQTDIMMKKALRLQK